MSKLIHLIYSSAAKYAMSQDEIEILLNTARRKNAQIGITGMLLYVDGSFFQVLEGESETVDTLFETIQKDARHTNLTLIIREPIAKRIFADWTMGYTNMTSDEARSIWGSNDFLDVGKSFKDLTEGRAKKLLLAFKEGRWRSRLRDDEPTQSEHDNTAAKTVTDKTSNTALHSTEDYTFAFQPIVDVVKSEIFSYEALLRGSRGEGAGEVLSQIRPEALHLFDKQSRIKAIKLAASLDLKTHLNLNVLPKSVEESSTSISTVLETAEKYAISPDKIVIEILEHEIIRDPLKFSTLINEYRSVGVRLAIDDFGSGYAGLNLLADFQPDLIKLDMHLIRGIDSKGPRQAIVRGIIQTCTDLGIEIIAEGVETLDEYLWLRNEGIGLYQGYLFAKPAFEELSNTFHMP